jgi:thiol-disulfide isomerase/thioredoxin
MFHQARLTLLASLLASASFAAEPTPVVKDTVTLAPVNDKDYAQKVIAPRKGKAVLVTFWASYCVPCLGEIPALIELKKTVAKKGGDVVFVNVDPPGDPAQIQKVAAQKKLPKFDSLIVTNDDPQPFIDSVDKKWMGEVPFAAIYGKDGTLKKTLSGEQKVADLEKALAEVL